MNEFNEDYYMNGIKSGVSNYENYRWLEELTLPMAARLGLFLDLQDGDTVLDFGCARGYLVKALRRLGVDAYGYDISKWAIENCDPEVTPYVGTYLNYGPYDHVIAKDVLEHIPEDEIESTVISLFGRARNSLFIIVPLVDVCTKEYIREEDRSDVTHRIRWTFDDWMENLESFTGADVLGSYSIEGLKPASKQVPGSTGFFWIRK